MNKFIPLTATFLATLTTQQLTFGAVLASYDFEDISAASDGSELNYGTTTTLAGVTGTAVNGSNSTANTVGDSISGNGISNFTNFVIIPGNAVFNEAAVALENGGLTATANTTLATAIADDQFFTFTLSAGAGSFLDLDTLQFNLSGSGARPAQAFGVRSSADGFAADLLTGTIGNNDQDTVQSVDLSSLADQSSIEFRIYVHDRPSSGNGGSGTALDDIVINGELVPEPSSTMLLSLGVLGLIGRRKR